MWKIPLDAPPEGHGLTAPGSERFPEREVEGMAAANEKLAPSASWRLSSEKDPATKELWPGVKCGLSTSLSTLGRTSSPALASLEEDFQSR